VESRRWRWTVFWAGRIEASGAVVAGIEFFDEHGTLAKASGADRARKTGDRMQRLTGTPAPVYASTETVHDAGATEDHAAQDKWL